MNDPVHSSARPRLREGLAIRMPGIHLPLRRIAIACWIVLAFVLQSLADDVPEAIQFNRDVRPILSNACFRCHGFDAKTREANLRLDMAEGAFAPRENGSAAIVPGKSADSLLLQRIESTDEDTVMPPPNSHRQLNADEKKLIRRWIDQGANYEKHWSFEPIRNVELAQDLAGENPSQSIDRLLARALTAKKLSMQGPADPATLVRRLSFTLTGLPPAWEEIESFAANPTEQAYEQLVDRYLASPHYGEEMARHWLDVARYGDTHGLHLDNERQIWPYRDWVVTAFNQNLPFDQFTVEQIAGDLLPNPTTSQLVATGFNRCNVTTSEGGAIDDEFLFRYAVDRTSTTVQAWLGLTAGCAVCHDHKYDPLTTREFYSMYAFFYNNADPAMDGNINVTNPFLSVPTMDQQSRIDSARERVRATMEQLLSIANDPASRIDSHSAAKPAETALIPSTQFWLDDELPLGANQRNTSRNEPAWTSVGEVEFMGRGLHAPPPFGTIPSGRRALRTEFADRYEFVISGGIVPRWIPDKGELRFWVLLDPYEAPDAIFVEVQTDGGSKRWGWANSVEDASKVNVGPERLSPLPERNRWTELSLPLSDLKVGSQVKELKLGLFGGVCWWDHVRCDGLEDPKSSPLNHVAAWAQTRKGIDTPMASPEVAKGLKEGPDSEAAKQNGEGIEAFFHTYVSQSSSPRLLKARSNWLAAKVELAIALDSVPGTMIFKDRDQARTASVMKRGQYDQKGDPVEPATPAVLPPIRLVATTADANGQSPRLNRLDLARWIVSDTNPLAPRVAVNRLWQQVFGVGIVKTSEDFGTQGSPPSHPELLEWMSYRFRNEGWNVKRFMKELVMTNSFRQSSIVSDLHLSIDPENRLLARGPRIRLDAEQIRDNVLAVSGLLNKTVGGAGFRGYQPPNIWEPVGYGDSNTRYYIQDHGDELYRRSLYTFIKRTAPPPFMTNFDAPNREMICARRERSNTPLQALQLMNDIQHIEAARVLAEKLVVAAGPKSEDRVQFACRRILGRDPEPRERELILAAYRQFEANFASRPDDAERVAHVGEKSINRACSSQDVATCTLLCNLLFNLDETVTRN